MKKEERQQFGERVATALRERSAIQEDTAVVKAKAWSKLNGGFHTNTDAVFDTGCTHPITTRAVAEGMKASIEPLDEVLENIQASGELRKILGTIRLYIEAEVHQSFQHEELVQ